MKIFKISRRVKMEAGEVGATVRVQLGPVRPRELIRSFAP